MVEAATEYRVIGTNPIRPDGVDKVTGRTGYDTIVRAVLSAAETMRSEGA